MTLTNSGSKKKALTAVGWVRQYSPFHASCHPHAARTGHLRLQCRKMKANTHFNGY